MKWTNRENVTFPNPDSSTKCTCTHELAVCQNASDCDDDDDDDKINFGAWLAKQCYNVSGPFPGFPSPKTS